MGGGGRYELTLFGRIAVREFERTLARMDGLAAVSEFVGDLGVEGILSADLFDGATIDHTRGPGVATVVERFADATELRIVDPPFTLLFVGLLSDAGPLADVEVTVFVPSDVLSEVTTFNSRMIDADVTSRVDLYEFDGHLPFSFALVDRPDGRTLCLVLGDGRDGMALVETDAEAAVEWGERLYERTVGDAQLALVGER